jgi:hypothetical protein
VTWKPCYRYNQLGGRWPEEAFMRAIPLGGG